MSDLELYQLGKTYPNGYRALERVDFQSREGEFIVLVGPSGCGKSTLLRMIAGLETPTRGAIKFGNVEVTDKPPAARNVAMVFQDYALYPHMSVRDNLSFGLKVKKTPQSQIDERIQSVSELLQIESLLDRKPAELSGGQRQRVAIGRAIVRKPEIFLFDEPLSNLDAQLRVQMRHELSSLHKKLGKTSVYVTHDQVEAMTMADRMIVLNAGVVQQIGTPMELYEKPANQFVATFIGNPSMNLIHGQLSNGAFEFDLQSIQIDNPPNHKSAVLGIRPESLKLTQNPSDLAVTKVTHELHGHEVHFVGKIGENSILARSTEFRPFVDTRPGEVVHFEVDRTQIHWFSSDSSGSRIG